MIEYDKLVAPILEGRHALKNEEIVEQALAFYKGEKKFEEIIGITDKYYLKLYGPKNVNVNVHDFLVDIDKQVAAGNDDVDLAVVERVFLFHMRYCSKDIINLVQKLSDDGLVKHFKSLDPKNRELQKLAFYDVFDYFDTSNASAVKFISKFKNKTLAEKLIFENEELKTNGLWEGEHNFDAEIKISQIKYAYELEAFEPINDFVIETVMMLCDDYCRKDFVDEVRNRDRGRQKCDNREYRLSLSDQEKNTMRDLLCGKISVSDAFESLIKTLFRDRYKRYRELRYPLFRMDQQMQALVSLVEVPGLVQHSPALSNLTEIFNIFNPYYFSSKVIYRELKGGLMCAFRPCDEFITSYSSIMEKCSDKDNMTEAVFIHAIRNLSYGSDIENTMRVIQYLVERHGEEYIISIVPNLLSVILRNRAYAALRRVFKSSLVEDIVDKQDEAYIKSFAECNAINEESQTAIIDFLKGKRDENIDINALLVKPSKITEINLELLTNSTFANYFELICNTGDKELIASRFKDSQDKYKPSNQFHQVLELFIDKGFDLAPVFEVLCEPQQRDQTEKYYEGITHLHNRGINCFAMAKKLSANDKIELLKGLAKALSPTRDIDTIVEWFNIKEKSVQQQLQEFVSNAKKNTSEEERILFIEALSRAVLEAKDAKEQFLVQAIILFKPRREQLDKIYKSLTEAASREFVLDYLDISVIEMEGEDFDFDSYLKDVHNAKTKFPEGIFDIELPQRKDGVDARLTTEVFLQSYMACREDRLNKEGILIADYLEENSLAKFAEALYNLWMVKKDAKLRWMMVPAMIHGDKAIVAQIVKTIMEFADNSRGKMATFIIMSVTLRGDRQILKAVDKIRRTTKYKSLRNSAIEALELAARERKISRNVLNDTLTYDYGFDNGPVTLAHGEETLKFHLQPDFKLAIERSNGKFIKSIPKTDSETTLKQSKAFFSKLKKDIKEEVAVQTSNLEEAFCRFRIWDGDYFQQYIANNLFVRQLAQTLVWGVYSYQDLEDTFYINDGFKTIDDKEIVIPKNARIAIVHPIELDQDANAQWQAKLKGLKVKQVFDQLKREIITIDNPLELQVTYPFARKSPSTVVNRLRKKGWEKGSVVDGGSFHEFYTEIPELYFGVEMTLDEYILPADYGYGCYSEDGLVGVKMIEFYKPGSVDRGVYCYDEIQKENTFLPSEQIPRVVNEMMATIKRAFE